MSDQYDLDEIADRVRKQYEEVSEPAVFEVEAPQELMLSMSDGVKLRTCIYRPGIGTKSLPVIISRCCYPHNEIFLKIHGEEFAKRGFAFVYQFCRGTGGSEGVWEPNVNERSDGYDTLNWLCGLDWVDTVGYWGSSYLALTGWSIIDIVPDKVKTMYLTQYGTDRFVSAYKDGLFRHDVLTSWAMGNAGHPVTADYLESCNYRPHIEVDEKFWGGKLDWYRDWVTAAESGSEYWKSGFWKLLKTIPEKISMPVYIGESWHDHHLASALTTYDKLSKASKNKSTLRIGAWNHMFLPCLSGHECKNLENNDIVTAMDWFHQILVEKVTPKKKVLTYIIGEDRWQEWEDFPLQTNSNKKFYFVAEQRAPLQYQLSNRVGEDGELKYIYDPEEPVMTLGGDALLYNIEMAGSVQQPECGYRKDVLSFVSEPFKEGLLLAGKMECRLFVSSDASDTAFTVKIMEVFSDGRAFNIRGGITTMGFRNKSVERLTYEPDTIEEITIEILDITWKLKEGSRLRIDITSSNFPEYALHSNYPGIWSLQEKTKKANQTFYTGKNYPSCIFLPILE